MTVTFDLHVLNGLTGAHSGPAGAENETHALPIGKHVKNILRSLKAQGGRHHLMQDYAELPWDVGELPAEQAMPAARPKRVRKVQGGPRKSQRMASLGAAK